MSRKDYILVAHAFRERLRLADTFGDTRASRVAHLREIADTLCERFAHDNPAFRRSVFLAACGFEGES